VICQGLPNGLDSAWAVRRKASDPDFLQQGKVSLFLTRYDLGDKERSPGGDGFLGQGAAGFAHHEMVSRKNGRHFAGPAEQLHLGCV